MYFNLLHVLEKRMEYYTFWKTVIIGIVWFFYFVVFSELTEDAQTIRKAVHFPSLEIELALTSEFA